MLALLTDLYIQGSAQFPPVSQGSAFVFVVLHGIYAPFVAIRQRRKLVAGAPQPPTTRRFQRILIGSIVVAFFSCWVADAQWIPLFGPYDIRITHIAIALVVLAAEVAFMRPRLRATAARVARPFICAETPVQHALWTGISFAAGIGEEITYRAVLTTLLARVLGNVELAILVSAVIFGLAHMNQGWKNAAIIGVFGLIYQLIVAATGTLYVAMAVHVVYDLVAGWTASSLMRDKLALEAAAEPPSAEPSVDG